jgi:hypothetical protein
MAKVSKADYAKAKDMYFKHISVVEIAEVTGIPRTTIQSRIKTRWEKERLLSEKQFLKGVADLKREAFMRITELGPMIVAHSLESLAKRGGELEVKDLVNITKVVESVGRIMNADKESSVLDAFNINSDSLEASAIDPLALPKKVGKE